MPRKNGAPFSIKDWQVDVRSRASTNESPTWIRVKGLTSANPTSDADTEDGSSAQDLYGEPYVTKRNGGLSLEGKRIVDPATGAVDPGQAEIDYYATLGGIDADMRMRLTDAVGNSTIMDMQVTSDSVTVDETSQTVSYEFERVGAPIPQTYVQATAVAIKDGSTEVTAALALVVGTPKELTIAFTPTTASNQKYYAYSSDPTKISVAVDGSKLTLTPLAETASAVTISVRTMNNSLTDTCTANVTAE